MGSRYRFVSGVVLGGIVLASTLSVQAQPAESARAQQGKQAVTKSISKADQKAARDYFTRDRIAAAQPLEMPAQTGAAVADAVAADVAVTGAPGRVTAGKAAAGADAAAQAAFAQDWAAEATAEESAAATDEAADIGIEGTSQVYSSYVVNKPSGQQTHYPHRWIGRLSFSTPNGTSFCSATAQNNNHIVTAAHCVYDTGANRFYSNWVFAPAYRNGSVPYGTFAATSCTVLNSWVNLSGGYSINSWAPHDVAVCRVGTNSAGSTLNANVGWAGRQWNWPYARHYFNLGYPFRDYNTNLLTDAGLYLRTCVAESFAQATEVRGMGCNWGGGISGGPWLNGYKLGIVTGAVDGVNSGIFIGTQNIYGARFNSNNIVVLCNASGC